MRIGPGSMMWGSPKSVLGTPMWGMWLCGEVALGTSDHLPAACLRAWGLLGPVMLSRENHPSMTIMGTQGSPQQGHPALYDHRGGLPWAEGA